MAAIVVTIAILDGDSHRLVTDYEPLINLLPDAEDGHSPAKAWNDIVLSPGFATAANLPPQAAGSVRIYERYFYLDGI